MNRSKGSLRVTLALISLAGLVIVLAIGGPVTLALAGEATFSPVVARVVDTLLMLVVLCVTRLLDYHFPARR